MQLLVDAFDALDPPPDPLDIWVWEVLARAGVLEGALCVDRPLVDRQSMTSVEDSQDDPTFLNRVYAERGYGR